MKAYNINDFAVLIGIDWADTKHDICEHPINTQKYLYCIIKSKPEALHDWAMSLKQRYPNQQIAEKPLRQVTLKTTRQMR